jgi:ribosome recycling factor
MTGKILSETEGKMKKSHQSVQREFVSLRTGKASASLLDNVRVDYHGSIMSLNQVASISVPEPRLIIVQAWDKSIVGEIARAIQTADLGFNPIVEGNILRLPVPALNEERRLELVKHAKKVAEDGKIAIRNVRREANDQLKKAEKDKQISEDEQKKALVSVQNLTDKYAEMIDDLFETKESEIKEV